MPRAVSCCATLLPRRHSRAPPDAAQNSIGLDGCRPTINSVLFAEAHALAAIGATVGDRAGSAAFASEAERWRVAVHSLWSASLQFFVTRTHAPPKARMADVARRRTKLGCLMCPSRRRCPPAWPEANLVDVRELMGLTSPWCASSAPVLAVACRRVANHASLHPRCLDTRAPTPPSALLDLRERSLAGPRDETLAAASRRMFGAAEGRHGVAFAQLRTEQGFAARWGARIAERRHACYNFSTACVTSWNAPVWPFESAKLGLAIIAALRGPHAAALAEHLQPSDFFDFLRTFARMHTRGRADDVPAGSPFVGESFHPDDGYWLTRALMFQRRHGDKRRGNHYFHSAFADLVLAGIVGVHTLPTAGQSGTGGLWTLVVQPLFGAGQLGWFAASGILVHGHEVEVEFLDASRAYSRTRNSMVSTRGRPGLAVWVDGALAACAETLQRLEVPLLRVGPGQER